jgi:hypothetical protein
MPTHRNDGILRLYRTEPVGAVTAIVTSIEVRPVLTITPFLRLSQHVRADVSPRSGATAYEVELSRDGAAWVPAYLGQYSYEVLGPLVAGPWYGRARARTGTALGPWSATVPFTVYVDPGMGLEGDSGAVIVDEGEGFVGATGDVQLFWNPIQGATGYRVERRHEDEGSEYHPYQLVYEGASNAYEDEITGIEAPTLEWQADDFVFHYRVRSTNAAGHGLWSAPWIVTGGDGGS